MEYLAELQRDVVAEVKEYYQSELGRFNIREFYNENKFDKRKFGKKCTCGFCSKAFNPFSSTTLNVQKEWAWTGNGQEAQKKYEVDCPRCEKKLRFTLFLDHA